METLYFLYMKSESMKRFQPVMWHEGVPTNRLIFASMFIESDAQKALHEAKTLNPLIEFKLVKVK